MMSPSAPPFVFDDTGAPPGAALVAEVPAGIQSKRELLEVLAARLQLPSYFGANWDALWDCLNDFSWLPTGPVVLRHADVPLPGDEASAKTYLTILRDAAERGRLIVGFPRSTRERVERLLGGA
jgi:RNAse (barnase) inhibitor barstar